MAFMFKALVVALVLPYSSHGIESIWEHDQWESALSLRALGW
jgi:hypothetical protein